MPVLRPHKATLRRRCFKQALITCSEKEAMKERTKKKRQGENGEKREERRKTISRLEKRGFFSNGSHSVDYAERVDQVHDKLQT